MCIHCKPIKKHFKLSGKSTRENYESAFQALRELADMGKMEFIAGNCALIDIEKEAGGLKSYIRFSSLGYISDEIKAYCLASCHYFRCPQCGKIFSVGLTETNNPLCRVVRRVPVLDDYALDFQGPSRTKDYGCWGEELYGKFGTWQRKAEWKEERKLKRKGSEELESAKWYNSKEQIIRKRDFEALFQLTDNADFEIVLRGILDDYCDLELEPEKVNFNHAQRVLYLCMWIVIYGEKDIAAFFGYNPSCADEVVAALHEIGAEKSAKIIKKIVALLPKSDGKISVDEFGTIKFTQADEENYNTLVGDLTGDFLDEPDGNMHDLFRAYAEKHKADIINLQARF
ncbi:MAG: DMP19 family protein [Firmicutes bacterium]|nr:DMP19 family protein [Bacillota bacterium]